MFWAIFIYLIGVVASYLTARFIVRELSNKWSTCDRRFAIIVSVTSWLSVVIYLLVYVLLGDPRKPETPAKW